MKKKLFDKFIIFICIFILIELLIKKDLIYLSIIYALKMWVNKLIPALFPFFIISDILINYNITEYIPKFIKKMCKDVWKITDNMLAIFILSMISGFPSNARNTRMMYDMNSIDVDEANHILMFSHFSNPIFILMTVGIFFFNNKKIGIIILVVHYLSNFILGFFLRNRFRHVDKGNCVYYQKRDFGNVFINAIKRAIDTILLICGIVVVFLMLASILNNFLNLGGYNSMMVKGLFEITIGIEALSRLNLAIRYKIMIASVFLSFGGLSVHMQVMSQITGTDIKYSYFFLGRIWQVIISLIISYFICILWHI